MKTSNAKKSSTNTKTLVELSTIPIAQGWFKNIRKDARFFKSLLSIQYHKGIAVDSLDSNFLSGEGGQFISGNSSSGFP